MRPIFRIVTVVSALLIGSAPAVAQQFFRVGSGLGGTYQVFGAKLAELVNKNIPGIHASTLTGGGEQSLIRIQRGEPSASSTRSTRCRFTPARASSRSRRPTCAT